MTTLGFPFNPAPTGRSAVPTVERRVTELIEMLLFTIPGERVMRPDLGTPITELLFEGLNETLAAALQVAVHGALTQHLAGIVDVREVEVEAADTTLEVTIAYAPFGESETQRIQFRRDRP
ncbi:GPW/gp25 family protein [Ancylobacter sp. 6x-1]|uniref:GPW/gp25 family protein n=1 Tax=Ancylobacter crimeensis TaxID=2579147 RepID=A0ABT0D5Y5_9HYPH|nr:GPW/gp25 family protein [Ancylobacter crimeensis]MCK0195351.1 GPW/gp25 family protein [Ancylobacter crimeensis]